MPVWRPFREIRSARPKTILFGQAGLIILCGRWRRQPGQGIAVVPGHPLRRVPVQLLSVPQQFREVIECIDLVEFAGVDQLTGQGHGGHTPPVI
jgi:hypothetical protein